MKPYINVFMSIKSDAMKKIAESWERLSCRIDDSLALARNDKKCPVGAGQDERGRAGRFLTSGK